MKRLSFRLRQALLLAGITGVALVGFGAASWYLIYLQKIESLDTEIRALGTRHPGWLSNRANFDRFHSSLEFIFGEEHAGQMILLVKDPQGAVLYQSPEWPPELASDRIDISLSDAVPSARQGAKQSIRSGPEGREGVSANIGTNAGEIESKLGSPTGAGPPWGAGTYGPGWGGGRGVGGGRGGPVVFTKTPKFFTVATADSPWRVGVMGNDDLRLVVGLSFAPVQQELRRIRNIFLATLPFPLLVVGAGGWIVAGRALRPLRAIAQTAELVTARGLDQRIPQSDEDPEISQLIDVLNGMMDRLETSFHQALRFSADASHQLKTPLTILQGTLENSLHAAPTGSQAQQEIGSLLDQVQRLKTVVQSLLLLSQADAGRLKLGVENIRLSEDMEELVEDAKALAGELGLQVKAEIQPGISIRGDRALLRTAVQNLVDNAIKYNEPGGSVGMSLAEVGDAVILKVCNTGTGVSPEDHSRIFDRFYRADQGRHQADGLGLGLSIAREIAQAHEGKLTLEQSRPGYTCFALVLKKEPPALLHSAGGKPA